MQNPVATRMHAPRSAGVFGRQVARGRHSPALPCSCGQHAIQPVVQGMQAPAARAVDIGAGPAARAIEIRNRPVLRATRIGAAKMG